MLKSQSYSRRDCTKFIKVFKATVYSGSDAPIHRNVFKFLFFSKFYVLIILIGFHYVYNDVLFHMSLYTYRMLLGG